MSIRHCKHNNMLYAICYMRLWLLFGAINVYKSKSGLIMWGK